MDKKKITTLDILERIIVLETKMDAAYLENNRITKRFRNYVVWLIALGVVNAILNLLSTYLLLPR